MKPLSQESRKRLKTCLLYVALPWACFNLFTSLFSLNIFVPFKFDSEMIFIIFVSIVYPVGLTLFIWVIWEYMSRLKQS